ncbi:MAG: beta-propeller fold lactonase family protein [Verrucomicrobia bacterium]|nr:beta-propeller fold lactonase family protein [Verrucomicrobiota bacterium]MBI3870058.1 beta-propeller fold lactonase family protein [Verrucomicrobiota bacterium]
MKARPSSTVVPSVAIILATLFGLVHFEAAAAFAVGFDHPTHSSPLTLNSNNQLLWVVNPDFNTVSVIRTDLQKVIATVPTGREPQSVAVTPDDRYAFVANAADGTVTVIVVDDPRPDSFRASVDLSAGYQGALTTGAEPWNLVISPDGFKVFVANSGQDTLTVIDVGSRKIVGHVQLRNSVANSGDPRRHFQPRGLAVTADSQRLYVTRFLSFTQSGGRQAEDLGREGLVAQIAVKTLSLDIADYTVTKAISLSPQVTGFKFPGLTFDTAAFPNQMQSIVLRGNQAYLPNIAASPTGPLRFNLDTHAFVNVIDGVNTDSPVDAGTSKMLNLHLGARDPEPGKRKIFFANVWDIAFTTQSGAGNAYVVSAGSDVLVKLNVSGSGQLAFTGDADTTRYIDLNDPFFPLTSGDKAGMNPQGIAITDDGKTAYVANFVSRNVSVVDLAADVVKASIRTASLPAAGSAEEVVQVGAAMFFSSRGNFDTIPGTNSLRDRLSSEGWQSCASCHFKGLTDGVVWSFAAGPRKSVPLNGTFDPRQPQRQRVLNYSAIFDEVEDFEANIRNVSGPGALAGGALDPNHGLLIGDTGDLNVAPSVLNAFARANVDRPQVTFTLPGSAKHVPALTALREWVRQKVRTPSAPLTADLAPGGPVLDQVLEGRLVFFQAGCASCHAGNGMWTTAVKDFISPPSAADLATERTPTQVTGNPVGAQFLWRFLRDVGSFNLGVPGGGNEFGKNIGAAEKAAPTVSNGVLAAAQDALGFDYNADGKGAGFNVPSLLGIHASPPYMHNGAAESLIEMIQNVTHRTGNGRFEDILQDPLKQIQLAAFLESIDSQTAPITSVEIDQVGKDVEISFDTEFGLSYRVESRSAVAGGLWTVLDTLPGIGDRLTVSYPIALATQFYRVVEQR